MHRLTDDQYFLILPELNLFPELKANTIAMIEQIMNAILLSSYDNIQVGINRVILLEVSCRVMLHKYHVEVLQELIPILDKFGIHVVKGERVRLMYPKYNKQKYYWDVSKQMAMNVEFALEKKLSYDGERITWEQTYIDWVDQLVQKQRNTSQYNSQDELIYSYIEPQATLKHVEIRDIIEKETILYVARYRQYLQNRKEE